MPKTVKTVFPNGKERSSKAIPESETAPATQRTGQSYTFGRGSFAPVTVSKRVRLNARLMISVTKTQIT